MTVETSLQLSRRTVWNWAMSNVRRKNHRAHLNSLRVHLVILFGPCPIQPSVPLFIDEKVWEVDFFELEFDGFYKFR